MAMKERTFENSEYRYGFNGKENDTDFGEHIQDLGARFYSGALGRMFSTDPMGALMCDLSVYQFAGNSPIAYIDYHGLLKHPTINLNALFGKPVTKAPTAKSPSNPNAPNRAGTGTAWSPSGGTYAAMVTIGMFPYIPEPHPSIDVSNLELNIESLKNIAMAYYGHNEGSWAFLLFLHGDDINAEIDRHNANVNANRAAANSPETKKFEEINRNMFWASNRSFNVGRYAELHQKRFMLSDTEMVEFQNLEVILKTHYSEDLNDIKTRSTAFTPSKIDGVKITRAGLNVVKAHLKTFDSEAPKKTGYWKHNKIMIDRLEKILSGQMKATDVDLLFYTHEAREAELEALGIKHDKAHEQTLKEYNVRHHDDIHTEEANRVFNEQQIEFLDD